MAIISKVVSSCFTPSKTRHLNESQENIDPFREVKLAQDCFNTVKFLVSSSFIDSLHDELRKILFRIRHSTLFFVSWHQEKRWIVWLFMASCFQWNRAFMLSTKVLVSYPLTLLCQASRGMSRCDQQELVTNDAVVSFSLHFSSYRNSALFSVIFPQTRRASEQY